MLTAQTLIAVRDVEASSAWYQRLLGCRSAHGGPDYERLDAGDGDFFMQLHAWDEEDHPNLRNPDEARVGHGVLLWFRVDDFDAVAARAKAMAARVVVDTHVNPNAHQRELWIEDPDGYVVVIASRPEDSP